MVIAFSFHLQCIIALGYGRQKPRLAYWSLIDEKERLIPSSSFETQETFKDRNYTIEYQKGKWNWLFHGVFPIIPLPIPFFIPSRMERVVIYEKGIPINELRTRYDYEFFGLSCNYIFPLVGRGCKLKFDKGYYPTDPKYEVSQRLAKDCSKNKSKELNLVLKQNKLLLNQKYTNKDFAFQISQILKIPLRSDNHARKLIYNYVQEDELFASPNTISFLFLKGIDQNEKSCSYQGKLEIFGHFVQDYDRIEPIRNHLNHLNHLENSSRIENKNYLNINQANWQIGAYQIAIQWNYFGYIEYVQISKN